MSKRYPPEVREKAVRLALEHLDEYPSPYAAAKAIGPLVDVHPETLRVWIKKAIEEKGDLGKAPTGEQQQDRSTPPNTTTRPSTPSPEVLALREKFRANTTAPTRRPRPTIEQPKPAVTPPGRGSKRNTWIVLAVVAIALCCCGGLLGQNPDKTAQPASRSATSTTPAPVPEDAPTYTATVDSTSGEHIWVSVDGRRRILTLAHVGARGVCGTELYAALRARLAVILPVGSTVTVVRAMPNAYQDNKVYLHRTASTDTATLPQEVSINEQLVAEGSAALNPPLTRDETSQPLANQIATIRSQAPQVAIPYIEALAHADTAAWDNRLGAIGQCRDRLDQEAQKRREQWGPDGRPGTPDDPQRADDPGPTYPHTGTSSRSDDDGGEGWFCRRKWWC